MVAKPLWEAAIKVGEQIALRPKSAMGQQAARAREQEQEQEAHMMEA